MNTSRPLAAIPAVLTILLAGCGNDKGDVVIRKLDDAKHAKIGVMTGTTGEALAKARFPQAEIKSFDDIMDAVGAMKAGQLDGVVTSYTTAFQVSKKNREFAPLAEPLGLEDTSVGFPKGEQKLRTAVNHIISELKSNGTLEAMKKRWMKDDLGPYEEPDIAVPTEGTPLRIGISATREPFNF